SLSANCPWGCYCPALFRGRFQQTEYCRTFQCVANHQSADHDHCFCRCRSACDRGVSVSLFSLRCVEALFRALFRDRSKRAPFRRRPYALALFPAAFCFGELFHHRLRVERLHPGSDDNARALQFALACLACLSRSLSTMKLNQLGEDRLLAQLLPTLSSGELVVAGVGDDCALVKPPAGFNFLVLKTDCVVEGISFLTRANPVDVGWKAMMRPLSDFAATSALPQFA